jgi:hypothetical protein
LVFCLASLYRRRGNKVTIASIFSCDSGCYHDRERKDDNMTFMDKMKKVGKSMVDSGAKTMLKVL